MLSVIMPSVVMLSAAAPNVDQSLNRVTFVGFGHAKAGREHGDEEQVDVEELASGGKNFFSASLTLGKK